HDQALAALVESRSLDRHGPARRRGPIYRKGVSCSYRLQHLHDGKYLTRPHSRLSRWWTKCKSTMHYVYELGPKGYAVLHADGAGPRPAAVLRLRDTRIGSCHIEHRLKLTTALLCLAQPI